MLLFGHAGITTGIVKVSQILIGSDTLSKGQHRLRNQEETGHSAGHDLLDNVRSKMRLTDFRLVLLGSLLPDIIDKPVWMFTNLPWDGRGYAHTFILNFVLLLGGLVLTRRFGKMWLLTLSLCSFIHLALDEMWLNPTALWWPLLGAIIRDDSVGYFPSLWRGLLANPVVYISEIVGLLIVLCVALRIRHGQLGRFLKTGDFQWHTRSVANSSENAGKAPFSHT